MVVASQENHHNSLSWQEMILVHHWKGRNLRFRIWRCHELSSQKTQFPAFQWCSPFIFAYPLVNKHNYGKSQFLMVKSNISMAIFNSKLLVYQRVYPNSRMVYQEKSDFSHGWWLGVLPFTETFIFVDLSSLPLNFSCCPRQGLHSAGLKSRGIPADSWRCTTHQPLLKGGWKRYAR